MVDTVVSAKVDPDTKARLIKTAGANGKNVNNILKEIIDNYLDNHDKLEHPSKYSLDEKSEKLEIVPDEKSEKLGIVPDEKSERLVILPPEDEIGEVGADGEVSAEGFLDAMWDTFRDYARERGYTLVKTDSLKKLLAVLKAKGEKEDEDEFECPRCGYTADKKFSSCPMCYVDLTWEDEDNNKK